MADKSAPDSSHPPDRAASRARAKSEQLRAEQAAAQRRRSILVQLLVVAGVAVVVVGVTLAVLANRDDTTTPQSAPSGVNADGGIYVGDPSAPVTLTMIEDFQCPACKQFETLNKELLDSYATGSEVRLEYRPISILDRMSTTDYSSRALNAAACFVATNPDQWRAYHGLLFDNQPPEQSAGLTDDALISLAVQAGAAKGDVASCINNGTYDDWGQSTTKANTSLPFFEGTPTVLVNGVKVETPSPEAIEAAVKEAQQ
jgi:protein-disulfide isomerase